MLRLASTGAALVMAAAVLVGGAGTANAEDLTQQTTASTQPQFAGPVQYESGADVYDAAGHFKFSRVYDAGTMGADVNPLEGGIPGPVKPGKPSGVTPMGSDSGSGGDSSASGCQRAWVDVWQKNFSNTETIYRWRNVTYWCWNRGDKRVYNVDTWWRNLELASSVEWIGITNSKQNFFSWIDGYPRSGHNNYREAKLKNCPFAFIPCDYYYPDARIQAHSNGTYRWWASW